MRKIKQTVFYLLLILSVQMLHAQNDNISKINSALDNILYTHLSFLDYKTDVEIPDSVKNKVINILNGYLPPRIIKEATSFDNVVMKNINKLAWNICRTDSICFNHVKDSIINRNMRTNLSNRKGYLFPKAFILAIGAWNVKDAIPILLSNINNSHYPTRETLLALAKLENDSAMVEIKKQYTLDYVVKHTVFKTDSFELIYRYIPIGEEINHQISFFYEAGMYLRDKDILLGMVNFLDITGKEVVSLNVMQNGKTASVSEELVPIEQSTLMWLNLCFIEKNFFENKKLDEWNKITEDYYIAINSCKDPDKLKEILSSLNKKAVKNQLKQWINENINF